MSSLAGSTRSTAAGIVVDSRMMMMVWVMAPVDMSTVEVDSGMGMYEACVRVSGKTSVQAIGMYGMYGNGGDLRDWGGKRVPYNQHRRPRPSSHGCSMYGEMRGTLWHSGSASGRIQSSLQQEFRPMGRGCPRAPVLLQTE